VSLRLPLAESAAAPEPPRPGATAPAGTPARRLLIVDDEEHVRAALVAMAASFGHDVSEASSGFEALAFLAGGQQVDLVLTDFGMPEMTGRDLLRAIKVRWPDLKVGLLTGWAASVEIPAEEQSMIAGILAKPVMLADMAAFIARATAADSVLIPTARP
jgi:CheY-like chemotaxis protein